MTKTDAEWRASLTPEQLSVARKRVSSIRITGKDHASKEPAIYTCACCGTDLLSMRTPSLIPAPVAEFLRPRIWAQCP